MTNRDRLATIELYRNEDGTIQMQHIHWIGKPWDGFWQYNTISEKDLNKILGMLKLPEVPEACAECEYRFSLLFNPNESFCCRLVKGKIKTFSGEEDPEKMTLEMINDDRWKRETPDWCPLKERNWKHG